MDDAGYQPAWPDEIWPWIRRPTVTTQQSGALVDYSWGAVVPGTIWRVFGQRPWHSDALLEEVAADPEVRRALEALDTAQHRLAADATARGLIEKPTTLGGLAIGVSFSGLNISFVPGLDHVLVNLHEIVDGFVHRAVTRRVVLPGREFREWVAHELLATLAEELAHTKGRHWHPVDPATGKLTDPIAWLTAQILDLPVAVEARDHLEENFRGILTPKALRTWGHQYARLRGEADHGG